MFIKSVSSIVELMDRDSTKARLTVHRKLHAIRTALAVELLANFYEKNGLIKSKLPERDLERLKIVALYHDSGRTHDGVDDEEEKSAQHCYEHLISIGVPEEEAKAYSNLILNKDNEKAYQSDERMETYRKLLHDADCLEIMRCTHFNALHLEAYKLLKANKKSLQPLKSFIDHYQTWLYQHGDLHGYINQPLRSELEATNPLEALIESQPTELVEASESSTKDALLLRGIGLAGIDDKARTEFEILKDGKSNNNRCVTYVNNLATPAASVNLKLNPAKIKLHYYATRDIYSGSYTSAHPLNKSKLKAILQYGEHLNALGLAGESETIGRYPELQCDFAIDAIEGIIIHPVEFRYGIDHLDSDDQVRLTDMSFNIAKNIILARYTRDLFESIHEKKLPIEFHTPGNRLMQPQPDIDNDDEMTHAWQIVLQHRLDNQEGPLPSGIDELEALFYLDKPVAKFNASYSDALCTKIEAMSSTLIKHVEDSKGDQIEWRPLKGVIDDDKKTSPKEVIESIQTELKRDEVPSYFSDKDKLKETMSLFSGKDKVQVCELLTSYLTKEFFNLNSDDPYAIEKTLISQGTALAYLSADQKTQVYIASIERASTLFGQLIEAHKGGELGELQDPTNQIKIEAIASWLMEPGKHLIEHGHKSALIPHVKKIKILLSGILPLVSETISLYCDLFSEALQRKAAIDAYLDLTEAFSMQDLFDSVENSTLAEALSEKFTQHTGEPLSSMNQAIHTVTSFTMESLLGLAKLLSNVEDANVQQHIIDKSISHIKHCSKLIEQTSHIVLPECPYQFQAGSEAVIKRETDKNITFLVQAIAFIVGKSVNPAHQALSETLIDTLLAVQTSDTRQTSKYMLEEIKPLYQLQASRVQNTGRLCYTHTLSGMELMYYEPKDVIPGLA